MTIDIGTVLNEAVERLTTAAGAVLVGSLTVIGIVQTAAEQDLARALLEWVLSLLDDPEAREEMTAEELESIEAAEQEIEAAIADLPFALGLSPEVAALLWLFAFVVALAVLAVAIDAFGNEHDSLGGIGVGGMGWTILRVLGGTIAFGILFAIGFVMLVLPGLAIAVLLVYFPAAIVLDDESVVGAFGTSVDIVRDNPLETVGIVVVGIAAFVAGWILTSLLGVVLPTAAATVVGELLSAVAVAFTAALIARGYVGATTPEPTPESSTGDLA